MSGGARLSGAELAGPAYINAYLNGMQFVLLALEGRLDQMDKPTREALREVLYEYHALAQRMRDRNRLGIDA